MRLRPNSALFPATTTTTMSTWCPTWCPSSRRSGYTLVEILVAMTLTLILMTAVVTVFGGVGEGISKSRRAMEQFDRLRTAVQQLRLDLQGVTVTLDGRPARPEESRGYFELIEGGMFSIPQPNGTLGNPQAINPQGPQNSSPYPPTPSIDWTAGERGDILMFTTRNAARPFLGRYQLSADPNNLTLQSDVAEVAWFLRGKTLHRRFLLVAPGVAQNPAFANLQKSSYYAYNDISARVVNGQVVPNSLSDLTKRENRFAHPVDAFPFDVRRWGLLGLPTLAECTSPTWMANWGSGTTPQVISGPNITQMDYWDSAYIANAFGTASPDQVLDQAQDAIRLADDVILNNVIGFDVKVWEPAANSGAGGYVDLGYAGTPFNSALVPPTGPTIPRFNHTGAPKSQLVGPPCIYDTYNFAYENEGIYQFDASGKIQVKTPGGQSTNGLDDDGSGIVDDASELLTQPPYPVPLRGIQITIRCYEPNSHQIRQVTIEHDFLPK